MNKSLISIIRAVTPQGKFNMQRTGPFNLLRQALNNGLSKERKIQSISVVILVGFVTAVFFHYALGVYLGWPYPYNTFLFLPADQFNDFYHGYNMNVNLNPYFGGYCVKSIYFPFANSIFYLFTFMSPKWAFALFISIFVLAFVCFNIINLKLNNGYGSLVGVITFSFLTYPFLIEIDRGNNEGLLFVFLCLFVYFKDNRPVMSLIFLSMAIAMKLYPAVFLVLWLSEKKYKEAVFTVCGVLVLTFIGLLPLKGGLAPNLQYMVSGFGVTDLLYFKNNDVILAGVSLFYPLKILLRVIGGDSIGAAVWSRLPGAYSLCMLAIFGLLALYVLIVEKELWKKIAVLVFAMLLFPHISANYKLMHVFIPLYLFINSDKRSKADWFYAVAFALLLIPKSYYNFHQFTSDSGTSDIGPAVFINQLIMLTMLLVICFSGMKAWVKSRRQSHGVMAGSSSAVNLGLPGS